MKNTPINHYVTNLLNHADKLLVLVSGAIVLSSIFTLDDKYKSSCQAVKTASPLYYSSLSLCPINAHKDSLLDKFFDYLFLNKSNRVNVTVINNTGEDVTSVSNVGNDYNNNACNADCGYLVQDWSNQADNISV